jgi:hypothetical protein
MWLRNAQSSTTVICHEFRCRRTAANGCTVKPDSMDIGLAVSRSNTGAHDGGHISLHAAD